MANGIEIQLQNFARHMEKLFQERSNTLHGYLDKFERNMKRHKDSEKERRCREENERKDKEIRRKQMEAEKKRQDRFEKNSEEFSKELKILQRTYLGEKKSVEKESFDSEDKIQEREVEKEKQENEVKVVEEVILETGFYPNLLPSSVHSIMQEVQDEIPKEQCSASIEVKLHEEFGDVPPKEVPCKFLPDIRMRHQVDVIPSAPLLTRPAFQIHEEVPPKEIEDKKIFFEQEKKKETCEEKVERKSESILFIENKVNVELWPRQLQPIFLCEDAYFITNTFSLHSGANSISKAHVLMIPRKVSRGFQRIMFDPGG